MSQMVSADECEEMNRLVEQGATRHRVAEVMDRHPSTVTKHCRRDCRHYNPDKPTGIESFDVIEAVERLAREIETVPAPRDWNEWTDRPCATSTLRTHCGNWEDILHESDLPVVPNRAPDIIRETRYNNSDFASEVKA